MKNHLSYQRRKVSHFYPALIVLLISVFVLMVNKAMCQDKQENTSKIPVTMHVSYKVINGVKQVKVRVTRKENGKRVPVDDATSPVSLYLNEAKAYNPSNGTGLIGKLSPDMDGEGIFEFPANFNSLTSGLHDYTFIAKMESDPLYEDAEEDITVSDAKISLEYSGKDSDKTATATLTEWKDTGYVPVPDVEMQLSIKRAFSLFPFSKDGATTDKNGQISADLPLDIPGNADGTITIVGSVTDNDSYGTVESTKKVAWGVLPKIDGKTGRTLWSNERNAPLFLVIISSSIIIVIWGTLIYLVTRLIKIRKIGKLQAKINETSIT